MELADNALAKLNNNSKNYDDELAQIYYAKAQALYFCEDLYQSTTTKTYPYMRIRDKSSLGKYEYEICILTQQVLKKDIANKKDEINIILNDINNVIEKYSLISVQDLSKIIINKIISYYKLNEKNT